MSKIVGILNITPDSFSDGGDFTDPARAAAHYRDLLKDGADIIDIGAESTRPGATPLTHEEEWARLGPVLKELVAGQGADPKTISIDTRHAATARKALTAYRVGWINDVGGLQDEMGELLAHFDCRVVVMHSLGLPADPQVMLPVSTDPIAAILEWKNQVTAKAARYGIRAERLVYDPGIGFGKTAGQSIKLIEGAETLIKSGGNWLYGHSRKSFLGTTAIASNPERDAATLHYSRLLQNAGVHYLRVHDVAGHRGLRT